MSSNKKRTQPTETGSGQAEVKSPTDLGKNLTGIEAAPVQGPKVVDGARQGGASPAGVDGETFASLHARLVRAYGADLEPIGTMPPPVRLEGAARAVAGAISGQYEHQLLLDKLAERLAFERTGTRLYEGLILKHQVMGGWSGGPSAEDLGQLRDEEHRHFDLLRDALDDLGGDPTALTPSADLVAMESMGLSKVIADPRTTLDQGLHAILVAELADNAGWDMLCDLADAGGHDELVRQFRQAEQVEGEHLAKVQRWLRNKLAVPPEAAAYEPLPLDPTPPPA